MPSFLATECRSSAAFGPLPSLQNCTFDRMSWTALLFDVSDRFHPFPSTGLTGFAALFLSVVFALFSVVAIFWWRSSLAFSAACRHSRDVNRDETEGGEEGGLER